MGNIDSLRKHPSPGTITHSDITQSKSFSRKKQVDFHNPAAEDNPTSSEPVSHLEASEDESRSINKDFHMVLELLEDHQNPKEEHRNSGINAQRSFTRL
ncbi:hypothetical protein PGTUg99_022238 [Puccinia graminis f. sp. tritici]|uniref:Uncharacterized protein n=1 Tax=Puccinia graminis f. sp. tritici TaxID=56615 RepID=A0A5B0SC29_PUCGR|nr:hypothetical protein PGTUg99_022238 [Puccinia graminis f. sp. tritici]